MGRGPEISRLRALTDPESAARRVLVVLGDAGAGKSALLADLARHARADGFRVLAISGRQPETNLEFAGLHQLLRPLAGHVRDLPGLQRNALQRVLGHEQEAVLPGPAPHRGGGPEPPDAGSQEPPAAGHH